MTNSIRNGKDIENICNTAFYNFDWEILKVKKTDLFQQG
jgi:hypothetical protein